MTPTERQVIIKVEAFRACKRHSYALEKAIADPELDDKARSKLALQLHEALHQEAKAKADLRAVLALSDNETKHADLRDGPFPAETAQFDASHNHALTSEELLQNFYAFASLDLPLSSQDNGREEDIWFGTDDADSDFLAIWNNGRASPDISVTPFMSQSLWSYDGNDGGRMAPSAALLYGAGAAHDLAHGGGHKFAQLKTGKLGSTPTSVMPRPIAARDAPAR